MTNSHFPSRDIHIFHSKINDTGALNLLQTDTASVLQEASLYIKLLLEQIQVQLLYTSNQD